MHDGKIMVTMSTKLKTMRRLLTKAGVAKLSAHYTGIHISPAIITYGSPSVIKANFHTTLACS